jgi:tetratricopeptide (TPR) repeat protein
MALHFTHKQPNPDQAASFFGGALKAAEQCGMDPFSKEVTGIRIRLAEMLEQFGSVKAAIDVLGGIVKDCEERLTELSRGAIQEALKKDSVLTREEQTPGSQAALLRNIIEAKVKIAQLYDSDYVQDQASAKKTLSDAIQLLLENTQDPQTHSFNENNAAGLSLDEIAAMLYDMGELYSASKEYQNAIEVYMLTLNVLRKACNGQASCREVEVMVGISATMGSVTLHPELVLNGKPSTPEAVKEMSKVALSWADGAIVTYEKVPEKDRDSTCYHAVFSAMMGKAGFLQQIGEYRDSKELWTMLLEMARKKGSDPELMKMCQMGVELVEESLQREGREKTILSERKN